MRLSLVASGLSLLCLRVIAGVEPADMQNLLALARTSPQSYPVQREAFLRTQTDRLDVTEATKAGWEAGLMALIINSRLEYPVEYQAFDSSSPMRGHGGGYAYGCASVAGSPIEASVFEQLWKGGRLAPPHREAAGISSEYGLLPAGARRSMVVNFCGPGSKLANGLPDALLLALVQGDTPDGVKGLAAHVLSGRETEAAETTLMGLLVNAEAPATVREGVLSGVVAYIPSNGWPILRDTFDTWGWDTNLIAYGYTALARLPEPAAHAQLRSIALDSSAAQIFRECAVSRLGSTGSEKIDTFRAVLLDPSSSAELKIQAIGEFTLYPGDQVRKLIEELDVKQFEPRVQKILIEAPAHVPRAGAEELRFVRAMSERTDLLPEVRQSAKEAADRLENVQRLFRK